MEMKEVPLSGDLQGMLLTPVAARLGVVVLAGSSGRFDVERARLFAAHGARAIALCWFGGEAQAPGICEVPLESFSRAVDKLLEEGCKQVAFVGTSKGAEAALLSAAYDHRIDAVVAISPSSVDLGKHRGRTRWPGLAAALIVDLSGEPRFPSSATTPTGRRRPASGLYPIAPRMSRACERSRRT